MKLSDRTISILKNFTSISPHLVAKKGNVVKTMTQGKTILAEVHLDQEFPIDFAIYDLARLVNGISLYKDPEVVFNSDNLEIVSENSKSVIYFCDPDIIQTPYREIKMSPGEIGFSLTRGQLEWIKKAAAAWGVDNIIIAGDKKSITLKAVNLNNPTSSSSEIKVGKTTKDFMAVFKVDTFCKPLPLDYRVEISSKGFAHFIGEGVEYYILLEADASRF